MKLFIATLLALVACTAAESCVQEENCFIANQCYCSSLESPIETENTPQFVTITFNDAITDLFYTNYYSVLLDSRRNPDFMPASATFYVPHEYTDYSRVNALYNAGHEIAVHTITKNYLSAYWSKATIETLVSEFKGQREIIARFANIPEEHIVGGRVPNFEMPGNNLFDAYAQAGIEYDNTWTARHFNNYFPFSLDYGSSMPCLIGECPTESYEGMWVAPIIDLEKDGLDCNNVQACSVGGTAEEISDWLYLQFNDLYEDNRAPMTLVLSGAWFVANVEAYEGFSNFLDRIQKHDDVFLVSHKQVIDWMKKPVSVSEFESYLDQDASCSRTSCALDKSGEIRYMVACSRCPNVFPWLDNPTGQ